MTYYLGFAWFGSRFELRILLPSLAAHGVVADIEAAWRLDGLLQVGHDLPGHTAALDHPQDGITRRVREVGAHTGDAERGGAGVALGGPDVQVRSIKSWLLT